MLLFRPVGLKELELIYESGLRTFPPRLPEQPIFYPVLNIEYAREIAFEWNTLTPPYAGYVTTFSVDDDYVSQFEIHIVGANRHAELWIPAEVLSEFNSHIIDPIMLVDARFGEQFVGFIPESAGLRSRNAKDQFITLIHSSDNNQIDAVLEITINHKAVFLNFPYWQMRDSVEWGIDNEKKQKGLTDIRKRWSILFPEVPLGLSYFDK